MFYRYSENDVNNTASNGAVKIKRRAKEPRYFFSMIA